MEGCGDCVIVFESIGLDSVIVLESSGLDSVSCASFRISALDSVNVLDSESTLDSVDSKFSPEKAAAVFAALSLQAFGTAIKGRASLFLV